MTIPLLIPQQLPLFHKNIQMEVICGYRLVLPVGIGPSSRNWFIKGKIMLFCHILKGIVRPNTLPSSFLETNLYHMLLKTYSNINFLVEFKLNKICCIQLGVELFRIIIFLSKCLSYAFQFLFANSRSQYGPD